MQRVKEEEYHQRPKTINTSMVFGITHYLWQHKHRISYRRVVSIIQSVHYLWTNTVVYYQVQITIVLFWHRIRSLWLSHTRLGSFVLELKYRKKTRVTRVFIVQAPSHSRSPGPLNASCSLLAKLIVISEIVAKNREIEHQDCILSDDDTT